MVSDLAPEQITAALRNLELSGVALQRGLERMAAARTRDRKLVIAREVAPQIGAFMAALDLIHATIPTDQQCAALAQSIAGVTAIVAEFQALAGLTLSDAEVTAPPAGRPN